MTRTPSGAKVLLFLLSALLLLVISCNRGSSIPITDSRIAGFKTIFMDSVYAFPYEMKERVGDLLEQEKDSITWYELLGLYSQAHIFTGEMAGARQMLRQVIGYAASLPESPAALALLTESYNAMAVSWLLANQPDSALYWTSQLEPYFHRVEGREGWQVRVLVNMADLYEQKGDLLNAAVCFRKALEMCDLLGMEEKERFFVYTGLGHTYMELRNFERSDYYYEKAAGLFTQVPLHEQVNYLNRRGNFYYFIRDYERCGEFFLQAEKLLEESPDMVYNRKLIQINLAEVYLLRNEPDSSRMMLDACRDFFTETAHVTGLHYLETLEVAHALAVKDYGRAARLIGKAMPDEGVATGIVDIRNTYFRRFYEETGDYRKAFEYLRREKELSDSLRSQRIAMSVAETELRYAQDTMLIRRDLAIEQHRREAGNLQLAIVVVVLCLIVAVGAGVGGYYRNKKRKELDALRYRYAVSELRMENIRNRIAPHFIFNLLSRVSHTPELTATQQQVLTEIAGLLKKNLELVDRFTVSLREELDFILAYLALEKELLGRAFTYTVTVDPDVDPDIVVLPSMFLHILTENAVKHGLRGLPGSKALAICVGRYSRGVWVAIEDNGQGFRMDNRAERSGTFTGMRVLSQTIRLLNSRNVDKIELTISDREEAGAVKGCRAKLLIPDRYSYAVFGEIDKNSTDKPEK